MRRTTARARAIRSATARHSIASRSLLALTVISTKSSKVGWCAAPRRRHRWHARPRNRQSATSIRAKHSPLTTTSRATRPPGSSSPVATRSSSNAISTRGHDRHRFTSWSMAKTVTAMLIGIAIAEGHIRSVDDPAAAYVPALADTEYGRTSFRHLLQMSSGVRFVEEYSGQDDITRLAADTFRQVGSGGVEAVTPFNVRVAPPGTRFYYASAETQVLGLVLRNAVGRPVADYLQEKIWEPMGAEADATWLIDRAGQEATYCCLNAVLRDYARLGLLLAHDGHWRGRQIIPAAWIEDATRVRPGQPQPRNLPATATAIRSGYCRASGGCLRSAASVARRSTSIRPAGSSWSTRRSGNRPAIRASGRRTRSGGASCESWVTDWPSNAWDRISVSISSLR